MIRILVTGSREWTDEHTVEKALERARHDLSIGWLQNPKAISPHEFTLIHGGARGADQIADTIWKRRRFGEVEVHKANWDELGKRAGFIRNAEMVKAGADLCLAFIKDESPGATMTSNLCLKAGIRQRVWVV